MTGARLRLLIAFIAFFGWISWLTVAVWNNGKVPVISRAQLTAASNLVVADVALDSQNLPTESVTITHVISGTDVKVGEKVTLNNLSKSISAGNYVTPIAGTYLIPIAKTSDRSWKVAGLPPSPGFNMTDPDRPVIYPWNDDVRKQLTVLGFTIP